MGFTFANGSEERSASVLKFTRWFRPRDGMKGIELGLSFAVFDRRSPILLGLDLIMGLGISIDFKRKKVYSMLLGRYLPTTVLPTGHLAWDLRPVAEDYEGRLEAFAERNRAAAFSRLSHPVKSLDDLHLDRQRLTKSGTAADPIIIE